MGPLTEKTRLDLDPLGKLPPAAELISISLAGEAAVESTSDGPVSPAEFGCWCCRVGVTDPTGFMSAVKGNSILYTDWHAITLC